MKRREFVQKSILGATATVATSASVFAHSSQDSSISKGKKFKLKFAPHQDMFKHLAGANILDQIKFMADQGFTAFELQKRVLK